MPNWAVLRECGQEPLQFICSALLPSFFTLYLAGVACSRGLCMQILISGLLQKVLDYGIHRGVSDRYTNWVKAAIHLPLQDLVVNLRERLPIAVHAVWRDLDGADPRTHAHKLATYHAWMASPLKPSSARGPPHLLPRYLQLELSKHVLRTIAQFRLCAHTLRVEIGCWQNQNSHCDKCDLHDVQDEKHVLFLCSCLEMCYLRRICAEQFADFTGKTQWRHRRFLLDNISAEDVKLFFLKQTYKSLLFFLSLWIFLSSWQCPVSPAVNPSG